MDWGWILSIGQGLILTGVTYLSKDKWKVLGLTGGVFLLVLTCTLSWYPLGTKLNVNQWGWATSIWLFLSLFGLACLDQLGYEFG